VISDAFFHFFSLLGILMSMGEKYIYLSFCFIVLVGLACKTFIEPMLAVWIFFKLWCACKTL
jgi:hypothetical protein